MNSIATTLAPTVRRAVGWLDSLQPLALLAARLYVAQVFWLSGLTKIRDWDTTLALFENEYQVPLLSPAVAAWMGTGGELASDGAAHLRDRRERLLRRARGLFGTGGDLGGGAGAVRAARHGGAGGAAVSGVDRDV